jgi:DNA polymerase sigma
MSELKLTDEDFHLRSLICKILEEVFKEFSPTVEVVPYGSSANGLGCKGSDLDITILIDEDTLDIELDSKDTDASPEIQAKGPKVYMFVVKVMRSLVPGCAHIIPIHSAKCPVIKFTHQLSGLSCDLTINNR